MKKMTLLAAAAACAMVASPALATGMKHSDSKAQIHSSKKMHHAGNAKHMKHRRAMHSDRHAMNAQRTGAWDNDDWDAGWDRRADAGWNRGTNTGFFPLDLATGVTAGAVGTAGAIAGGAVGAAGAIAGGAVNTAGAVAAAPFEPFRDDWRGRDSFASYNVPVSTINGPTCRVGTWTTINGMKMRCQ